MFLFLFAWFPKSTSKYFLHPSTFVVLNTFFWDLCGGQNQPQSFKSNKTKKAIIHLSYEFEIFLLIDQLGIILCPKITHCCEAPIYMLYNHLSLLRKNTYWYFWRNPSSYIFYGIPWFLSLSRLAYILMNYGLYYI